MKYKIELSGNFTSISHIREVITDINDFHNDIGLIIENIISLKEKKIKLNPGEPNGYVFLVDNEEDKPVFFITPVEFWQSNNHIDDGVSISEFAHLLPKGFGECMEACVSYHGKDDPKTLLLNAGFVEVKK